MTKDEYLDSLHRFVQNKVRTLVPEVFTYATERRDSDVLLTLRGPRLGKFTLIFSGEVAELIYDEKFHGYRIVDDSLNELHDFIVESIEDVVSFILSSMPLNEEKTIFFRRKIVIPCRQGTEWVLYKLRKA